ncbi:MAG: universal stress protein UspA [Gemmatales bacterium]|nr:MAG: universal stress protein UspA [Gemmatales bacterium]
MFALNTILHPTDFSERSDVAFQLASSLAKDHGAKLLVLHVVQPRAVAYGEAISDLALKECMEKAWQDIERYRAKEGSGLVVEHLVEEGDPATRILQVAADRGCDLIVMGTHGRRGLARLLMGSVAEQVVRKAPCPVVTVKQQFPAQTEEAAKAEAAQAM